MDKKILLSKKPMIIIGIFVSFIIIIGGYLYYISEKDSFREEKHDELKAISELKISQILKWRQERIASITVTAQFEFFEKAIARWITNKDDLNLKAEMEERLSLIQKEYVYDDICITNTQGELLFSIVRNTEGIDSIIKQEVIETAENRKIIFSDFFKCPLNGKEHLIISAPLFNDNEVETSLINTNKTKNSLIIKKNKKKILKNLNKGAEIQFLSTLKHTNLMEPTIHRLEPNTVSGNYPYQHKGEEFIYILNDCIVEFTLDNEKFILKEGDSIYFNSEEKHQFKNIGKNIAEVLCISSPPYF